MKKEPHSNHVTNKNTSHTIPDIQIIDLESDRNTEPSAEALVEASEETYMEDESAEYDSLDIDPTEQEPERRGFRINMHTAMHFVLPVVVIVFVIVIINRLGNIMQYISQEDIFSDGEGYSEDNYDEFFPLLDADGNLVVTGTGEDLTILMLGNSPLSDDKDSKDGLANMIAERTGANVINCAVSGSYMAAEYIAFNADLAPMDAYTPYWLCVLTCTDLIDNYYPAAAEALGENTPVEAEYVFETLSTLDMNTVDVIVFMYDGTDYLMGHGVYNTENPTDILQFTGNLEASIDVIQQYFPHIRIIVMSPAYAFGIDDNGEYISSDIKAYGEDLLSTYFYMEMYSSSVQEVSFVDNLYGTINEDTASEYLIDNIHLNVEGRKLMAERFIYALTYFDS